MDRPRTLFEKIWDAHLVHRDADGQCVLYIDRHIVHESGCAQAFDGLREAHRRVRRPETMLAVIDHVVPTVGRDRPAPAACQEMIDAIRRNTAEFGVRLVDIDDPGQGICHVVGPETGFTLPGTTLVCSDSHTATHGALGCLAFGIGTSECEQVMATQCLRTPPMKTMRISVDGVLPRGCTGKDLILAVIGHIGTAGGTGHAIEYAGEAIRALSVEARMTVCNMTIEGGAKAGMIAPDDKTFAFIKGRSLAPQGAEWDRAVAYWRTLSSDPGARYDREVTLDAARIAPVVSWGTSPEDVMSVDGRVPDPADIADAETRSSKERALRYMGLTAGQRMTEVPVDWVFIGSCTNSRIEDLRMAAEIARGRKVAAGVRALVVPGSGAVKRQAEAEGLDRIFAEAGFEWREPGCSMCLAMNDDRLKPQERCASTSNRNFEGRQGFKGRTHLVSPQMAAAAAIAGHFVDIRDWH